MVDKIVLYCKRLVWNYRTITQKQKNKKMKMYYWNGNCIKKNVYNTNYAQCNNDIGFTPVWFTCVWSSAAME